MKPFTAGQRADDLAQATAGLVDVLVVGMGATGAGVALDAASRGMSVVVLDQGDLAAGTSSKSSKLVHGGLRYLEHYELGLVREGVVERQLLMRLAPHLVRPMDFLYPVWPDTARRRLLGLGLSTYDVLAGVRNVRRHSRVTAEEAAALAPALRDSGMSYGYTYGDGATDDARLVLAVVRAARQHGAIALPRLRVDGLLMTDGVVAGAHATDVTDAQPYEIRARHVVNATGVWVDALMGAADASHAPSVQPSKGVHLVVPSEVVPLLTTSVLLPSKQGDGRSMFAIPWGRQTILGTTDTAYDGALDELAVEQSDVDYVAAATDAVFGAAVSESDIVGAWVGVRPLLRAEGTAAMSDLSRRHSVLESPSGLVTVTGGKLTTYRRMAEDVVDRLVARDGRRSRCVTDRISLGCRSLLTVLREETRRDAAALGLSEEVADSLVAQHGDEAAAVLALVAEQPSLGEPLVVGLPYLQAEVVHAVREEGALLLDDVLSRRTRVALRDRAAGGAAVSAAAELMAAELGRRPEWAQEQAAVYLAGVKAERGVVGVS